MSETMKLQLAIDDISLRAALTLVDKVRDYFDIIEVDTPFPYVKGLAAVHELRKRFPEKEILADMKITNAGEYETREALRAGADYVTVLSVTDILTVKGCLRVAKEFGKTIVAELIYEPDLPSRIRQLESVGVRALAAHPCAEHLATGQLPFDQLRAIRSASRSSKIFVAGAINATPLPDYARLGADVFIVGGEVCRADDPIAAARNIYGRVKKRLLEDASAG